MQRPPKIINVLFFDFTVGLELRTKEASVCRQQEKSSTFIRNHRSELTGQLLIALHEAESQTRSAADSPIIHTEYVLFHHPIVELKPKASNHVRYDIERPGGGCLQRRSLYFRVLRLRYFIHNSCN